MVFMGGHNWVVFLTGDFSSSYEFSWVYIGGCKTTQLLVYGDYNKPRRFFLWLT